MTARSRATRVAVQTLEEFGLDSPPFEPELIAKRLGAELALTEADQAESGFCLRQGGRVVIGVNSRHSRTRQRFTIAHELGHLLLHEGRELTVDKAVRISYRDEVSSMATDSEEIEANRFAASLLMPEINIRREVDKLLRKGPVSESEIKVSLSNLFWVSEEAMTYRLLNLGIMSG